MNIITTKEQLKDLVEFYSKVEAFAFDVETVGENRIQPVVNDVMLDIIAATPPPSIKGKYVRIKYVQQLATYGPSFAFFCNMPQYIPDSYKRFLENRLREKFDFCGVPVRIFFRKK